MITRMAQDARLAGRILGTLSGRQRTEALLTISKELEKTKNTIMAANEQDVAEAAAAGLAGPLLQRLKLSDKAFRYMTDRLAAVASLPDPLG
ncbi:MAG: gamma-glutamyl-phosphate reductase, partial [bacterium]